MAIAEDVDLTLVLPLRARETTTWPRTVRRSTPPGSTAASPPSTRERSPSPACAVSPSPTSSDGWGQGASASRRCRPCSSRTRRGRLASRPGPAIPLRSAIAVSASRVGLLGCGFEAEDGMVGGDAAQLLLGGVRSDAAEEDAHLSLPALQVRAQDRWLVVVGDLRGAKWLAPATEPEAALSTDAEVAAPLTAGAPADLEDARAEHADPELCQAGDKAVEDVSCEPAGALIMRLFSHAATVPARSEAVQVGAALRVPHLPTARRPAPHQCAPGCAGRAGGHAHTRSRRRRVGHAPGGMRPSGHLVASSVTMPRRTAPSRAAPRRSAPLRLAPVRSARWRSAPCRSAPCSSALVRSACFSTAPRSRVLRPWTPRRLEFLRLA